MFQTLNITPKSDIIGSTASILCLAHCLATPFLFVTHAGHVQGHHSHPFWWGLLDILFILISLIAVYWSARNTSKNWVRYTLWMGWASLSFVIINEKLEMILLIEEVIYIPSLALIALHVYNRKYCQCANDNCCTTV
ncbi:MerC domain-containing protein [uncultured Dokdonia sp.]|uniref:MerC domain-containing protein n=1 Tax=uncultured Dokdonia sp. TaxID=575653 RepID=UPI00263091CB|nr:MerC domain-containing protein [uncultured Dokdonia sp.]